jgi:XRE family aerobic/anaerobic benzoate catabolism transcriptional regulator
MASNRLKADASHTGQNVDLRDRKLQESDPPASGNAQDDETYLAELGARVRRIRAIRGMSRKVLAQSSGISERYIAQMEAGAGNVSIVLLRRISRATGVRVEDLIADMPDSWTTIRDLLATAQPQAIKAARNILSGRSPSPESVGSRAELPKVPRIALVGLRGAGKSSLGKLAAEQTGLAFMELNQEIESHHGLSVTEIFKLYGQEGYRRLELASLQRIIGGDEPLILATGGGIVADTMTYDLLRSSFFTIWIKAQPEEHMSRVRQQGDLRPMANDRAAMEELRTILSSREPLYGLADAQLDTSGRAVGECAIELSAAIRERFPGKKQAALS